jgi:diphthine synthase
MLHLIGLGLHDEKDLSLKAIEGLKACDAVYAELYTAAWRGDLKKLEELIGKPIKQLKREQVESDFLLEEAKSSPVALLVPGDPLVATTHFQFLIDAKRKGIEIKVIHSSSVNSAIAITGLHSYKFGRATTLPSPKMLKGNYPTSPYEMIEANKKQSLHSLVLLDIPMTVKEGLDVLLQLEKRLGRKLILPETEVVACAGLGGEKQKIKAGKLQALLSSDMADSNLPSCIVVPGELSWKEKEALEVWR